jgi:hypothetical protein
MSKISTYTNAPSPLSGSDKLIGTETGGIVENATKNFTVQELADFVNSVGPITIENDTSLFSTGLTNTGANSTAVLSNFFGQEAGQDATNADNSNFFGNQAGKDVTNATYSNFFGTDAGLGATDAQSSNFIGLAAGSGATDASNSNFLGESAGKDATNADNSNFFGNESGQDAVNAANSNFFGNNAGFEATDAEQSNFFGLNAGSGAINAYNSNFLGANAGQNSSGNNVNAFGQLAGLANALDGQTIFSNASMPSFADHAAAAAAITVLLGASAGSTYLYHNQDTDSIGAVRL